MVAADVNWQFKLCVTAVALQVGSRGSWSLSGHWIPSTEVEQRKEVRAYVGGMIASIPGPVS